jgi:hypothetical protein
MVPRERFVEFAKLQTGKPYRYGANGPDAYDCSGLVIASLRAAGPQIGDHGASDLWAMWAEKRVPRYTRAGQMFFYGHGILTHVMIGIECWSPGRGTLIGARGGGRNTLTIEDAWATGAYVATVMSGYWPGNLVGIVDPWED